jgi:hypothetical protein
MPEGWASEEEEAAASDLPERDGVEEDPESDE